jgi:hypothetical protein
LTTFAHFSPLLGLVSNYFAEIGGRTRKRRRAHVSKPRLDGGFGDRRVSRGAPTP